MEELVAGDRARSAASSAPMAVSVRGSRTPARDNGLMRSPDDLFRRHRRRFTLVLVLLIACTALATLVTQFSFIAGLASFPKAITWLATNVVPTEKSLSLLPNILGKLLE